MATIIKRGSVIPTSKSKTFTTTQDRQTTVNIAIYEGERALVKDNHKLGQFDVTGLPPAPRGTAKVDVEFQIDANSILTVIATEQGSGQIEMITIANEKGRLSAKDIERMVADAEKFAE